MKRTVGWWSWLATVVLLGTYLVFGRWACWIGAFLVNAGQSLHFAHRGKWLAVQVRATFSTLLVIGLWPPLGFFHELQLIGAIAVVVTDYCFLARALRLLPWNRSVPLDLHLLRRLFFSAPAPAGNAVASRRHDVMPVSPRPPRP